MFTASVLAAAPVSAAVSPSVAPPAAATTSAWRAAASAAVSSFIARTILSSAPTPTLARRAAADWANSKNNKGLSTS